MLMFEYKYVLHASNVRVNPRAKQVRDEAAARFLHLKCMVSVLIPAKR